MFFLSRINTLVLIFALVTYCGLHYFVYYSFVHFFSIRKRLHKLLVLGVVLFLGLSLIIESFLPHNSNTTLSNGLSFIFGVWLGLLSILLLSLILLWLWKWIYKKAKYRFSFFPITCFCFFAPVLIITYGVSQSFSPTINEVIIPVKNLPLYWKDKTIVHLADLHLRSNDQIAFVNKIASEIQNISPELVVITGDLIDRGNRNIQELLSPFKKIAAPILFTTGNHDRYLSSSQSLKDLGIDFITFLNDELYERENLQIIGLGYPSRSNNKNPTEILKNKISFDTSKPTILLYHTPTTIDSDNMGDRYVSPNTDFSIVKNFGIDLQLSGHTHGGQFFPFSVITHFLYNGYSKGLHRDGDFSLFVSTGLGTWGPPVRTFVPPEIAVICLEERNDLSVKPDK
jgi:uncharacterized protein